MPAAVRRRPDHLEIEWGSGLPVARLGYRTLRLACPCAACVDEMSGIRTLDPASVADDVHPDGLELVGAYGLHIRWSDGHATGIYTFESLRDATA